MTALALREEFPDLPSGEAVVFGALARASKPVEDLTVSEWADRYRVVSSESGSPWPGPFQTARVPHIREPQDCLHPDHPARRVTLRWAAQLAKSTIAENWFGYVVDQAPGSMMIVLPTGEEATKFNRIKLQPTIEASPRISHKVVPVNSRDEQSSTTFFKKFAGGFCQIVNAGSSKGLQMVSIKNLVMDEVTGYPSDVDGRGSPRDQARARQKMYGDLAKELEMGTPGIAGECAMTEDFDAGDQRFRYVPCPHCGIYQALQFEQLRAAEGDLPVHLRCQSCDGAILDGHKMEMMAAGIWIPTFAADGDEPVPALLDEDAIAAHRCDPCEGRCRDRQPSYHLSALYAPRERFADIFARQLAAAGDTTKMRTFCQQDKAEPYDPGAIEVDHEKIAETAVARNFAAREVPREAAILVSAADVQGYGIKWAVYALGPRRQRWLIDAEIFEGSPAESDEPWIALADALARTYATGNGEKGIDLSGVDSGFATQRVYAFCSARPGVYALDGRQAQSAAWLGSPKRQTIRDRGNLPLATTLLYPVNAYDPKVEVVASLANFVDGPDQDGRFPRNTLHLPGTLVDTDFAKELTAERLVDPDEAIRATARRGRKLLNPRAKREWRRISGRANDWFDVTVYAYALMWWLETKRRMNEERWKVLLDETHGGDAATDLFAVADETPFARAKGEKKPTAVELMRQLNKPKH